VAYDCGVNTIVAEGHYGGAAIGLHCGKWPCEFCAPWKRSRLIARGIRGKPNRHIVLTSVLRNDITAVQACRELIRAWARVYLHIKRELKKPLELRWKLKSNNRSLRRELNVLDKVREDEAAGLTETAYGWFTEATQNGWPHMHILFRGPYIPQDWLSEQMGELTRSPIVWINKIEDIPRKVAYAAGYCAKETNHFGTCNRYSFTRNYELPQEEEWQSPFDPRWEKHLVNEPVESVRADWERRGRYVSKSGRSIITWGLSRDPVRIKLDPDPPRLLYHNGFLRYHTSKGWGLPPDGT